MFTREEMDRLTATGPNTPGGELLRRYWQPVALAEELKPRGDPVAVTVLGDELVLFRDGMGRPSLLDRYCAHRGTDLVLGWCEERGIRCMYHGWLYGSDGQCLEQPAEPPKSRFHARVRLRSFPCVERAGIVFAYLGPGEPPLFPDYEFLRHPSPRFYATKLRHECNYLQGNEGNLDQSHLGFLHRMPVEGFGHRELEAAAPGSDRSPVGLTADDVAPKIECEHTDFGFREYTTRRAPEGTYLKIQSFVLPNLAIFPGAVQGRDGHQVHWHVPIDDQSHWKYVLVFRRKHDIDHEMMRRTLIGEQETTNGYRALRTRENGYLQDREAMRVSGTSGLGLGFEIHDLVAVESQGAVQDRAREQLGYSDKSVIALRRAMLDAIRIMEDEGDPPHVLRSPTQNCLEHLAVVAEILPADIDKKDFLLEKVAELRRDAEVDVTSG